MFKWPRARDGFGNALPSVVPAKAGTQYCVSSRGHGVLGPSSPPALASLGRGRPGRRESWCVLSLAIALGLGPTCGHGRDIDIIMALPAQTLTFSTAFVAEDAGFYRNEGLKVSHRFLVGVASPNAVIAGSADFTIGTGPVFLRAAAQGQRMLAIANLLDKPLVEMVLRKDAAEAAKITPGMPLAERAMACSTRNPTRARRTTRSARASCARSLRPTGSSWRSRTRRLGC